MVFYHLATPPPIRVNMSFVMLFSSSREFCSVLLERELSRREIQTRSFALPDDDGARLELVQQLRSFNPNAIAAGGAVATQYIHQALPDIPLTYFMVPNPLDLKIDSARNIKIAGTSSDVAPPEQCEWIKKTAPKVRRVAILYSDRTKATVDSYVRAGRSIGLNFVSISTSRDDFMQSIDALTAANVDGVLMLPDAAVYSAQTVQRLLVWGIREKKPIWTFSPKLVEAGAYASMHPDVSAVGTTTAQRVVKQARGEPVNSKFDYAPKVNFAINMRTAELIGTADGASQLTKNVARFGEEK